MNVLFLILGAALLLMVAIDLLWTTIWVEGSAGPLSNQLAKGCWLGLKKVSGGNSRLLSLAGPMILTFTLLMWIFLLWAGWTFFFAGSEQSILVSQSKVPISSWAERIYFVGFVVFTLGVGDYIPNDGFWQITTTVATGSGMLFITLSVSYVVSVVGGVIQKRAFASSITGQGKDGITVVKQGWNGSDYSNINLFLKDHAAQLSTLVHQHKAYPILHYYHTSKKEQASSMAIAIFDEALTIYKFGVNEQYQPNKVWVKQARSSVKDYLELLNSVFAKPARKSPPAIDLDPLRSEGLPVKSNEEFNVEVSELKNRREKLLGLLEADAWKWPAGGSLDG
ncbi:ion channel [Bacillus sp. AK031]